MSNLYDVLQYPERAEYLEQYATYDVDLDHWRVLSTAFQKAFQTVFVRRSSAILLVHGAQGSGKTLFSKRLQEDFDKARKGPWTPNQENLWHTLVRDDHGHPETIRHATESSLLRRIEAKSGWHKELSTFAEQDTKQARIFVIDDMHRHVFMCEWAGLTQSEYLSLKNQNREDVVLDSVAEQLVADCRGNFQRSVFLLLSNKADTMTALRERIDSHHRDLAAILELPLPAPEMKERIVRKNINRLNPTSYWFCLDAAERPERSKVREVLVTEGSGFTDSFEAVASALSSGKRRSGRPANRNLLTLVTLGVAPHTAKAFTEDHELQSNEHFLGNHLGIWFMKGRWASVLYTGQEQDEARRARMMESEFALRWVALDMRAAHALCQPPQPGDVGERLLSVLEFFPSVGKPIEIDAQRPSCEQIDAALTTLDPAGETAFQAFEAQFRAFGQSRSVLYEKALRQRFADYGKAMEGFGELKPDVTLAPYQPCAVTSAATEDEISNAIRRTCHTLEFTAFLREDLQGLDKYLLDKVKRYGALLESL